MTLSGLGQVFFPSLLPFIALLIFFSLLVKMSLHCRAVLISHFLTSDLRPAFPQRPGPLPGLCAEERSAPGAELPPARSPAAAAGRAQVLAGRGFDVGRRGWTTAHS